ncbi:uncharacterized protein LOC132705929 [Cylas formicarius]|uniref:uncharacterized protein LOC132705929 n=1 Tax=Cylas formicarius TaxID=197179 RepID=UPI0029588EC8|nr:uncharacterized protein LOC132705929 [Cylas formicarius]
MCRTGLKWFCLIVIVLAILFNQCECTKRKTKKSSKGMALRQKETNIVNFIRLAVMRLIYGVATRVGLGEQISEVLNGAFIPPGAEDYDDYGGGLFREDDDDYDY